MKEYYKEDEMLREEIVKWIGKTFGKPRKNDMFQMDCKIAEGSNQGRIFKIEEISFVFQRRDQEVTAEEIKKWREELNEITGNSLRTFHVGDENLYGTATKQDIQDGAMEGELVIGKAMMMNVVIFKKRFIANSIVFPGKLTSNRRH